MGKLYEQEGHREESTNKYSASLESKEINIKTMKCFNLSVGKKKKIVYKYLLSISIYRNMY